MNSLWKGFIKCLILDALSEKKIAGRCFQMNEFLFWIEDERNKLLQIHNDGHSDGVKAVDRLSLIWMLSNNFLLLTNLKTHVSDTKNVSKQ